LWKALPSMRTTIHVFGRSRSGCSKAFTYSYLRNLISTPVRVRLCSTYFEFAILQSFGDSWMCRRVCRWRLPRSEAKAILEYIGDTHVSTLLFKHLEVNSNTRVYLAVSSLLFIYSNQKVIIRIWESLYHVTRSSFSIVWNMT
jgi:hypothetical protein